MAAALATRHLGRVVKAYRTHPYHQRTFSQTAVGAWICVSQTEISRMENGPAEKNLDKLTLWARVLDVPAELLWFELPDDQPASSRSVDRSRLAPVSAERTAGLVRGVLEALDAPLAYHPPAQVVADFDRFLGSSSQVFTLTGPPGSGKTRFTYHVATQLVARADFQLHSAISWAPGTPDITAEILRYASVAPGSDPILELEMGCTQLDKPLCVVIDGVTGQDQFDAIGATVERVLRLVTSTYLRFVLVYRSPPGISLAAFPVLAASTYRNGADRHGVSAHIAPWTISQAREVWDHARGSDDGAFDELPTAVQQLTTVPLYLGLLKTAGAAPAAGPIDAYRLVDHCVQTTLRSEGAAETSSAALTALARTEAGWLVPDELTSSHSDDMPEVEVLEASVFIQHTMPGAATFSHDVIREYFLAGHIAELVIDRGRSIAVVRAINTLAHKGTTSATARGVFDLAVHALDHRAPELLAFAAVSPTVDITTTLPLLMRLAGAGTRFDHDEVWRTSARHATASNGLTLARTLIASPRCGTVLGEDYPRWLVALLRSFGSEIWTDLAATLERTVDSSTARQLLEQLDVDDPTEATFAARHLWLFDTDEERLGDYLDGLIGHPDWRVRAALAAGLGTHDVPPRSVESTIERLVEDGDYKVRAAVATAITRADPQLAHRHVPALLRDESWHVRARLVEGLIITPRPDDATVDAAVTVLRDDGDWRSCPTHLATLKERLFLLHDVEGHDPTPRQTALWRLLREIRTGALGVDHKLRETLVAEATSSARWLTGHEAILLDDGGMLARGPGAGHHIGRSAHQTYRRLRGSRAVQVALDLPDLDRAIAVAKAAARAGADLIEVGDPLIKELGLHAVEAVKRCVPTAAVVAEMMSADWGRDQVVLAAEAGADVAFLIGPASAANVATAVDAGRRLGVPVVLDVAVHDVTEQWVTAMVDVGVDGFTVTTNIDLGVAGRQPFATAEKLRAWTRLPVAVSGGFSPADHQIVANPHWDIVIVGRSIAEAVNPSAAARQFVTLARAQPTSSR